MQKIVKIIKILSIIVFIIASLILILLLKNKEKNDGNFIIEEFEKDKPSGIEIKNEPNYEFYYSVKEIIKEYYTQITNMNLNKRELSEIVFLTGNETTEELNGVRSYIEKTVLYAKTSLYHQLGSEYIQEFEVTEENINTKFEDINFKDIIIDEMYVTNEFEGIYTYLVKGNIIEKNTNTKKFNLMVIIDRAQNCFSIYPQNYIEKHNYTNKKLGENLEVDENKNEIKINKYNTFKIEGISKETKINQLFQDFKYRLKYNLNESANIINKEYANIRFDNSETEIIEYLGQKAKDIQIAKIDSYLVEENENSIQYIMNDNKGNYYIFRETTPLQYTVILDNYTIPTENFIKEYNKRSEVEKVIINIKKFFMGIDNKNYGYSYSVLAESFKSNKYPTKTDFINYIKQNFFEENEIEYISYEKENGMYIYKVKIKDATQNISEERIFNIIVRLGNQTDFEMSIGIN